jgi:predicted dehydrogenase
MRRRNFLKTAAATGGAALVPRHVVAEARETPPSEKLALAGVGIGGVGFPQLQACETAGFRIVALCDVDEVYAKRAFERWPQARRYRDFREMLQNEDDRIDAVYCGTPDHTHAVVTLAALRRKKHVCCVKPLTRTIAECRLVVRAAAAAGVATQVTASENNIERACRTCELIWAGVIGDVRELHVWSDRPLWPQGMVRPDGQDTPPPHFDWNLWLGPAPSRPFRDRWPEGHLALQQVRASGVRPAVYHPWNFRGWWDFGTGALGDMGCHHINTPYRALKLRYPTRVHATATRVFPETAPLATIVAYDFPAREGLPEVRVVWYDGGLKPPRPRQMPPQPLPAEGVLYIGEQGVLLAARDGPRVYPEALAAKAQSVPQTLPRQPNMWHQWLAACKGGEPAGCHFAWAGLLTEFVLLGNIAIRTGRTIEYDADKMRIIGDATADQLLAEPYHNGWSLEG